MTLLCPRWEVTEDLEQRGGQCWHGSTHPSKEEVCGRKIAFKASLGITGKCLKKKKSRRKKAWEETKDGKSFCHFEWITDRGEIG